MKNCGQADVELDAALEHLEYILEYIEENLWTYRPKIGTFRSKKLDAESEYLAEISLFNLYLIMIGDADGDTVLLASCLVAAGRGVEDTVGVSVESDFSVRNCHGPWRNAFQVKLDELVVVLGHGPLPLTHLDGDGGLVDAGGLNTQRGAPRPGTEVSHGLVGVTGEYCGLHSGTIGHNRVEIT